MSGLHLISPTSVNIPFSGSVSVSANGGISCTSTRRIDIRNVFSTNYDNYMIVMSGYSPRDYGMTWGLIGANDILDVNAVYAYSGTQFEGTGNYDDDDWGATSFHEIGVSDVIQIIGYIYSPLLAEPTMARFFMNGYSGWVAGAGIMDGAAQYKENTIHNGIYFQGTEANPFTGTIRIYGLVK